MHEEHRKRMRQKFLKEGLETFPDHEKLEFLLFNVISRKNTNDVGHKLLDTFGSFSSVLDAPIDTLMKVDGVGEAAAVMLKLIPEVCRYYLEDKQDYKSKVVNPKMIGDFFLSKFIGRMNETVILMLLDSKSKMLYCGVVSEGSVNSADIYIRKIIEMAMRYNASQAIIAHNHPSGVALPSKQDLTTTAAVSKSLEMVGVRLIDHVIVADNDYVSLAQSNLGEHLFH